MVWGFWVNQNYPAKKMTAKTKDMYAAIVEIAGEDAVGCSFALLLDLFVLILQRYAYSEPLSCSGLATGISSHDFL